MGDPQDGREGAEQFGGTHGAAPGPGSGHFSGSGPGALTILSHSLPAEMITLLVSHC